MTTIAAQGTLKSVVTAQLRQMLLELNKEGSKYDRSSINKVKAVEL